MTCNNRDFINFGPVWLFRLDSGNSVLDQEYLKVFVQYVKTLAIFDNGFCKENTEFSDAILDDTRYFS